MVDFVFIDSGTGGIPYLDYLKKTAPQCSCVYVADNANFPYGEKSHQQIVQAVTQLVQKIVERFEPKTIVIACNTMSVNALSILREIFPRTLFVGTVPAIKLAAAVTKNKCIGLLATSSTVSNPYNQDLKNHFAADCSLVCRADPELISFVEHKSFTATEEEKISAVMPAVNFFKENGCDTFILGCTHFLHLKDIFIKACDGKLQVVDSVDGVVRRALFVSGVAACKENEGGRYGGTAPVRRGSEQRSVSEGKAFPPQKKSELYATGFSAKKDENEYTVLCEQYDLLFKGKL